MRSPEPVVGGEEPVQAPVPGGTRSRRPLRATVIICVVCLALTALATWAAASADNSSEHRLLEGQTKQAGEVLSTAILLIQEQLDNALSDQKTAGAAPDPAAFRRLMSGSVAPDRLFLSASLWKRTGRTLRQVAQIGAPGLAPGSTKTQAQMQAAFETKTFSVRSLTVGNQRRIAYALADPSTGFLVYAERVVPPNRRAPVDKNSAFVDLHYAIYLGPRVADATLSTTDLPPSRLPLTGNTAKVKVPFGDTVLVLVTQPRRHLGAPLTERLPLILLFSGLLLTVVAARTGQQLGRGLQVAEQDAATITALYERVEGMYGQQRELSVRLQRALLPHANPDLPNLEISSEYVAGARGVDIGGDWYSIIGLGKDAFGFVVGDVSGKGVDAVAVMAHARFTLRTYLLDGHGPAAALEKSSRQFDIAVDGHMTTAIVGRGNWHTGEITLANAGHPAPLLVSGDDASFVVTPVGPPLGVRATTYESTTFTLPPGATLFCFTDGLVERRGEDIDVGMDRLARTAREAADRSVDDLVAHALQELRHDDAPDDVAVLAMRWVPVRARFAGDAQAPADARTFVREHLEGSLRRDDVVLVVSELVTNSVRAGAGQVDVYLEVFGDQIDLKVTDDADGWPAHRPARLDDPGGRGLSIVEQLADTWDISPRRQGKIVKARFIGIHGRPPLT